MHRVREGLGRDQPGEEEIREARSGHLNQKLSEQNNLKWRFGFSESSKKYFLEGMTF
jgi:hypothetical protein